VYFCSYYFLLYMLHRTFQLADAAEPTYKPLTGVVSL
jgi:hypothetical protein